MTINRAHLDMIDEIMHEAAIADMDSAGTDFGTDTIRSVAPLVEAQLATLRRRLLPERQAPRLAAPVNASLLALGREALQGRLAELTAGNTSIRYAHRRLHALSDDDLRRLIDVLERDGDCS